MTGIIPQLIISLSPDGASLQAELPGANGSRRVVPLQPKTMAEVCQRILQAQTRSQTEIGLDGAPTARQVRHWERHEIWPDDVCPFCLAEGRCHVSAKTKKSRPIQVGDGSVTVRRLAPKGKGRQSAGLVVRATLDELGL